MQDKGVKGVNSVVLDSMLSPFGKELSAATNLPVFDEVSMLKLFSSALSLSHFSDASVLYRLEEKSQSQRSCLVCKFRVFSEEAFEGVPSPHFSTLMISFQCLLQSYFDFLPCTVSSLS